jgi:hypothetical protein
VVQAEINQALNLLATPLANSITSSKKGWRQAVSNFTPEPALKGSIDLSPGWFAQGQDVRSMIIHHPSFLSRLCLE